MDLIFLVLVQVCLIEVILDGTRDNRLDRDMEIGGGGITAFRWMGTSMSIGMTGMSHPPLGSVLQSEWISGVRSGWQNTRYSQDSPN